MKPYIHHIPGRLRVSTGLLKRPCGESLAKMLPAQNGVTAIEFNRHAGSLTLHYDQDCVTPETLLAGLRQHGVFDPVQAETARNELTLAGAHESNDLSTLVGGMVARLLVRNLQRSVLGFVTRALV